MEFYHIRVHHVSIKSASNKVPSLLAPKFSLACLSFR